jgi:hypothetical protein
MLALPPTFTVLCFLVILNDNNRPIQTSKKLLLSAVLSTTVRILIRFASPQ